MFEFLFKNTKSPISELRQSLKNNEKLNIEYTDKRGKLSRRYITVKEIRENSTLLVAYCHTKKEDRHFIINNIKLSQSKDNNVSIVSENEQLDAVIGLTKEQLEFLSDHNLPLSCTYDATGLRTGEYISRMKELDKLIAFGVNPCKKFKHRLRTSSGHCVQCNPAAISFITRYSQDGSLYILSSRSAKAIKVGFSLSTNHRIKQLNEKQYGGATDWRLVFEAKTPEAGRLENEIHSRLSHYKKELQHLEWDKLVTCQETFSCSAETAVEEMCALQKNIEIIFNFTDAR